MFRKIDLIRAVSLSENLRQNVLEHIRREVPLSIENKPIYLCIGLQRPIKSEWEGGKNMNM